MMMINDEDDEDFDIKYLLDISPQLNNIIMSNRTPLNTLSRAAILNQIHKFEVLFDIFTQSNSSKTICKCFEIICKSLRINTQNVFEQGFPINLLPANPTTPTTPTTPNYPMSSSTSFQMKQLFTQISQPQDLDKTTRMIYKIIRSRTTYWKTNELWQILDKKSNLKEYTKNTDAYRELNVLIVGSGPVGLRMSIECALLGAKCTVVEKRDRFSRNNVIHLWPFSIIDLKNLGAKIYYGKFCAGAIDHISKLFLHIKPLLFIISLKLP